MEDITHMHIKVSSYEGPVLTDEELLVLRFSEEPGRVYKPSNTKKLDLDFDTDDYCVLPEPDDRTAEGWL